MLQIFLLSLLLNSNVSFKEPVDLNRLMKAMDECIMFNPKETKERIKSSRQRALLPEVKIGGRFEQNDLEANKITESSPYLLTDFKSGWVFEVSLKWGLDELLFSNKETDLKKEYQSSLERYISLQRELSESYFRLKEIIKRLQDTNKTDEIESLEKEYNLLNAKINVLTCHKFKTIQEKEE